MTAPRLVPETTSTGSISQASRSGNRRRHHSATQEARPTHGSIASIHAGRSAYSGGKVLGCCSQTSSAAPNRTRSTIQSRTVRRRPKPGRSRAAISAGSNHSGGEYRRWVPDTPDLPIGADALLKARQRALDSDQGGDVAELRDELARLGVVVRDEAKRQYWRRHSGAAQGGT
jgi:hypothetical protein